MMIDGATAFPRLLAALVAVSMAGCSGEPPRPLPAGAFRLADPRLSESSGLVASRRFPGTLWSINDSGSFDVLYRVGTQGEALGRVALDGAWLRDAESLALWRHGGQDWLLVADIGDNRAWRGSVALFGIAEPAPGQDQATVAWSLRFRYPDGPRDAEAMAVDPLTGDALVLTKRDRPPRLYRLPLARRSLPGVHEAEFLGTARDGIVAADVTGLDVSPDGRALVALTYRHLHLWRRSGGETWAGTLARAPETRPLPEFRKAEAVAFVDDGDRLAVTSEREPRPLWYLEAASTGHAAP